MNGHRQTGLVGSFGARFGSRDPHSITALIVGLLTLVKSWVVSLANACFSACDMVAGYADWAM
jgi:hypothetical protein